MSELGKQLSGYKVKVEGEYIASTVSKGKVIQNYSVEVNLPTMDCALSILKGKVLPKVLSKRYKDFVRLRSQHIMQATPFGDVVPTKAVLWQMNEKTIHSYIKENSLPVKPHLYENLLALRTAVQLAEDDPDRFARKQGKLEKDFKVDSGLRALNPEFYDNDSEPTSQDALTNPEKLVDILG
ncbi:MAG: hypothetical protein GY928_34455 [Colwellia sp.]|nr:hypothetical protein [Colwellia sp.]